MKTNLEASLRYVLAHEGGYSNHPADPGGATNYGITQRVYDAFRQRNDLRQQSVRAITSDEVAAIYKRQYWDAVKADDLPTGLDYAVFDYAVNSGPKRAVMDLQRVLGVKADGVVGNVTLAAASSGDVFAHIDALCNRRMAFLQSLKTWKTFGRGWGRRVAEVAEAAAAMATGKAVRPSEQPTAKAEEVERESVLESKTVLASGVQLASGVGGAVTALGSLDGTAQIVLVAAAAVVIVAALFVMRERLRHWAEGVR